LRALHYNPKSGVLGNRVAIAVAGARATKGCVDEDPDLRVPDYVPRHCVCGNYNLVQSNVINSTSEAAIRI
jgi:hypothetical protein